MSERVTADTFLARPLTPCGTGVLVLAGSSGRIEQDRAELLARHGAAAMAMRWFGGAGQRPAPHEVPLELFVGAVDRLAADCERVAIIGASFGAEAALLTAVHDARVAAVVGLAPTSVVWGAYAEERWSSHWTLGGHPLPYVPFVEDWNAATEPPAYRELYESSLDADPVRTAAASIPVERISGDVVLAAGADDQVWPSLRFARLIERRRIEHGLSTTVVCHPDSGHRVTLPGEPPAVGGHQMARGGTPEADAALGAAVWPELVRTLRLQVQPQTTDRDRA